MLNKFKWNIISQIEIRKTISEFRRLVCFRYLIVNRATRADRSTDGTEKSSRVGLPVVRDNFSSAVYVTPLEWRPVFEGSRWAYDFIVLGVSKIKPLSASPWHARVYAGDYGFYFGIFSIKLCERRASKTVNEIREYVYAFFFFFSLDIITDNRTTIRYRRFSNGYILYRSGGGEGTGNKKFKQMRSGAFGNIIIIHGVHCAVVIVVVAVVGCRYGGHQ